jgi:hypothetical protein
MRVLALMFLLALTACSPQTKMIKDGNGWVQKTDEHSWWWSNTISQRRCVVLENGFCKEDGVQPQPTLVSTDAPGPKLVGAVLTTAGYLGGAAIITHGLQTQAVSPGANILGGASISTINVCGTGPAFVGMKPAPGCK